MTNDRTLELTYNNLLPFTYPTDQIESNGADAVLKKLNKTGLEFNQAFDSGVGFLIDSLKAEISGGSLKGKDTTPINSLLASKFNDSNLNWCKNGSLIGTVIGAPVIADNKLDCTGELNKGLKFSNAAIASMASTGTIEFGYTPGKTTPDTIINILEITGITAQDRIIIFHSPTGNSIRITSFNSSGNIIHNAQTIGTSPFVGGVRSVVSISFDASNYLRVFSNGVLIGQVAMFFARGSNANNLYVGTGYSNYPRADGIFDSLITYSTQLRTANYTVVETPISNRIYLSNEATLPAMLYAGPTGNLVAYESFAATIIGDIKFIMNDKYWNGTAWITSPNTLLYNNTLAEVQAHIATLSPEDSNVVKVILPESNSIPSIGDLRLFYTGQKYSLLAPTIMLTVGTYLDGIGTFILDALTPVGTFIRCNINVNNVDYFWNGGAWVESDLTLSDTNTLEEIIANIGELVLGLGKVFKLRLYLISTDETLTPSVHKLTMTYDFAVQPNYPVCCRMYGFITTLSGLPVADAKVEFSSKDFYSGDNLVAKGLRVTTDVNGYYESDLVRTETPDIEVTQKVTYKDFDGKTVSDTKKLIVPNLEVAPIAEHLVA